MLKTILNPRQILKVTHHNYSSTSASNTSYFNLQEPELSPDYFKTLTEKTEINTTKKLKRLEQ